MDNLLIVLDPDNKKHLYEQIYDHIKKEIREGKLCYGERLPSARLLAQQLQISRSTVDLAYGQLVSEGYLEAKPCQGYFVSHVEELYHIIRENDDMQEKEQKEIQKQQTEDSFLCDFPRIRSICLIFRFNMEEDPQAGASGRTGECTA